MTTFDTNAYLATWNAELQAKMNRVRNLIGSAHWPTDGRSKEVLIRNMLIPYLPAQFGVGTGFVRSFFPRDSCSPETDVLVFDKGIDSPIFFDDPLVICSPRAIAAAIEIKSELSSKTLFDSLEALSKTSAIATMGNTNPNYWSGAIFFAGRRYGSVDKMYKLFETTVKKLSLANTLKLPNVIGTLDGILLFPTADADAISVKICTSPAVAAAQILLDLISTLRVRIGGPIDSQLGRMAEVSIQSSETRTFAIGAKK